MRLYNVLNKMLVFCCIAAAAVLAPPAPAQEVRAVATVQADARTGRLVRRVTWQTRDGKPLRPEAAVRPLVEKAAREHELDPLLVDAVIRAESGYNPAAVSPKGAAGLMQLMPSTARRHGVRDRFDPGENIRAGVRYLKALREAFGDDRLALAAYNAGEGAVLKHGGVPPYPETIEYLRRVQKLYESARASQPPPAAAPPAEPPVRSLLVEQDESGRVYLRTR
jgi:soluble lytic murein transglycosylase-like protein